MARSTRHRRPRRCSTWATCSSRRGPSRSSARSRASSRLARLLPASAVDRLAARLSELAGAPVELERPQDPAHGDYATNVALQSAPQHRRAPREFATKLVEQAGALDEVERADVAGPGFVNLWLTTGWLGEALAEIGPDYGRGRPAEPQRIQVELVSANPAGPLTVGSARNGAYGDSVARLLSFAGHQVEREYYYNGAGRQIELFRASVEARRRGEPVPEEGYKGDYVETLARAEGDPVEEMLRQIEATMERFRVHFDSWALQSKLEQKLPELLPRLDTYERDGAVYARSSAYGDDADWVLIRSDEKGGLPTYRAADVAAEKTQKNPVYYVQYAHARIAGILRNAGDAEVSAAPPAELSVEERELVKRLAEFPAVVAEAAARRGPQGITTYAIRVADDFHRFYHENLVLGSDEQAFRLALVTAA